MNKTTLVILAAAVLALGVSGCASTQNQSADQRAEAQSVDKPVTRPFSGVGSYGGYSYRRYE
jgi:outer membrane lipoprotein SlyB